MTVVDDIKGRLDLLEVVSHYIPMQRSGRSYKANCPFHQEKTPSFYVFPDRQTWRCFGACASGGDVYSFVMRAENLEFAEALRRLAQQTGVALPSERRRGEQQASLQATEAAGGFFRGLLTSSQGAAARRYLASRGLTPQTSEKFELGLSPGDGESLKNYLVSRGFSLEQLALAGLVRPVEDGRYRDLFRGRLMMPIRNEQGHLAGFGGRALDDSTPKYLNSPAGPSFDKGRILYAMDLAKEAARQQGIVIVEGYMDAMMAHQHGFNNVVASLGTALTEQQVAQVRRITGNITMALDPDAGGRQATLRSLESSWRVFQTRVAGQSQGITLYQRQEPTHLKVAALPEGLDPDEVIHRSPEEWASLVERAVPLLDYLFTAAAGQVDLATAQGKARAVEILFPLIAAIPEPAAQDHYFQELAARLGVTAETLRASVGRPQGRRRNRQGARPASEVSPSAFAKLERDPLEEHCLALLLQHPELADLAAELQPEYLRRMESRELFNHWRRLVQEGRSPAQEDLRAVLDEELSEHLEYLSHKVLPPLESARRGAAFRDTVRRLEDRYLRDLKAEEELRFTGASADPAPEIQEEVLNVNQRIKRNQATGHSLAQNVAPRR